MGPKFWTGGEMQIESILQYYSVPTVSARNALYELAARKAKGFSEEEVHCGVHPNPLGHRCSPQHPGAALKHILTACPSVRLPDLCRPWPNTTL